MIWGNGRGPSAKPWCGLCMAWQGHAAQLFAASLLVAHGSTHISGRVRKGGCHTAEDFSSLPHIRWHAPAHSQWAVRHGAYTSSPDVGRSGHSTAAIAETELLAQQGRGPGSRAGSRLGHQIAPKGGAGLQEAILAAWNPGCPLGAGWGSMSHSQTQSYWHPCPCFLPMLSHWLA